MQCTKHSSEKTRYILFKFNLMVLNILEKSQGLQIIPKCYFNRKEQPLIFLQRHETTEPVGRQRGSHQTSRLWASKIFQENLSTLVILVKIIILSSASI